MFQRLSRKREEEGFTLIELLIVIVILGILAAVVVFAVGGISDRGKKSACKSDLKTVETAVEAYYAKNSAYPATLTALTVSPNVYLKSVPNADDYDIEYVAATGAVTADPGCDTL